VRYLYPEIFGNYTSYVKEICMKILACLQPINWFCF